MVAMFDADHSGKLSLSQLKHLLVRIVKWSTVFRALDTDHSHHLSVDVLRTALHKVGLKLNNRLLIALYHRYASRDGTISFVDFITCAVKIKTMLGELT